MDCPVVVHLIRHAKTKSNDEKRYLGWKDEPILKREELPVVNREYSVVFGSDLVRCKQTAEAYFPGAVYIEDEGFRELNFSQFEGKTYEELKGDQRYQKWLDDSNQVAPPDGETLEIMTNRCRIAFKKLPQGLSVYPLVVHGGTIRVLLTEYAPYESQFWDWVVTHNDIYTLEWESRRAFEEGERCTFLSVVPITANMSM